MMSVDPDLSVRHGQPTRLDAFVDAAFAFALTLLVISDDRIPDSIAALIEALKNIPAFALSFLLIVIFWVGHVEWRRHYGCDDIVSRRLSLLLVFLMLVFVYPMRMVFESLCQVMSGGYLPANYAIAAYSDISDLFVVFGVAFGSMGAVMAALYAYAWRRREAFALDAATVLRLRTALLQWSLIPAVSLASIVLALLIPASNGLETGIPGFIYFSLNITAPLMRRRLRRRIAALEET
jgi:uncharacterized membrane protein